MQERYDYDSIKNQAIKGKFVDREVIACQTCLVDELLKREVLSYDNIENLWIPEDEDKVERLKKLINALENALTKFPDGKFDITHKIEQLEKELQNLDTKPQEIYEWWLVTKWFADKLRQEKEPILECPFGQSLWWGRCTSGQAILLDGVITTICSGMGILEGPTEWKV